MKEFNIGERVKSLRHDKEGVVDDKLYSNKVDDWMYTVQFDDSPVPFSIPFYGSDLVAVDEDKTYRWEVFQADNNVVTAVMYETINGVEREVDRQHGHCIHSGMVGVGQAASYAMKKIYINMNGGKFVGTEDN